MPAAVVGPVHAAGDDHGAGLAAALGADGEGFAGGEVVGPDPRRRSPSRVVTHAAYRRLTTREETAPATRHSIVERLEWRSQRDDGGGVAPHGSGPEDPVAVDGDRGARRGEPVAGVVVEGAGPHGARLAAPRDPDGPAAPGGEVADVAVGSDGVLLVGQRVAAADDVVAAGRAVSTQIDVSPAAGGAARLATVQRRVLGES